MITMNVIVPLIYDYNDQGRLLVTAGDPVEKVEVGGKSLALLS